MATEPVKYKIGASVEYTNRNGDKRIGRVAGSDVKATGQWVAVNFAERGSNPDIVQCRPSMLRKL